MSKTRAVIAGGGTGGHLFPGIALAEQMQSSWNADILFIGTSYGIENRILKDYPYKFKKIWMRGLNRKLNLSNLLFPLRLLVSTVQCLVYFWSFKPAVIVGTGGYVSGPALIAGMMLRIPTVIQEQNSYPGLVNRWLGNHVNQVHITYEDSRKYFTKQPNLFKSGNPVRVDNSDIDKNQAADKFGLDPVRRTLLVFGGSQGAQAINRALLDQMDTLMSSNGLQILWATGEQDYKMIEEKTKNYRTKISVHSFISDMVSAYKISDLAVCRSGASTLSELAIHAVPAILVPFPYATAGHQEANARSLQAERAALVILEEEAKTNKLHSAIKNLLADQDRLNEMREAIRQIAKPDAGQEYRSEHRTSIKHPLNLQHDDRSMNYRG